MTGMVLFSQMKICWHCQEAVLVHESFSIRLEYQIQSVKMALYSYF